MELETTYPIPKVKLDKGDIIQVYHCYTMKNWRGEYIQLKEKSSIEEITLILFLIDYIANYLPNGKYVDDCVGEIEAVNILESLFNEKFIKLDRKEQHNKDNHLYSLDLYEIGECNLRVEKAKKKEVWYKKFKGNSIALKIIEIRIKAFELEAKAKNEDFELDEDYQVLNKVLKIFKSKSLKNDSWECLWGDTDLREYLQNFNLKVQ